MNQHFVRLWFRGLNEGESVAPEKRHLPTSLNKIHINDLYLNERLQERIMHGGDQFLFAWQKRKLIIVFDSYALKKG